MLMRPARGSFVGATVKLTVPVSVPAWPELTTIQSALLTAVQGQPRSVLTVTDPAPPAALKLCVGGESVQVQVVPVKSAVWSEPRLSKVREAGSKEMPSFEGV